MEASQPSQSTKTGSKKAAAGQSLFAQRMKDKQLHSELQPSTVGSFPSTFQVSAKDNSTSKTITPIMPESRVPVFVTVKREEAPQEVNIPLVSEEKGPQLASEPQLEDISEPTEDKPAEMASSGQNERKVFDVLTATDIQMIQHKNMQALESMSPEELQKQQELVRSLLSAQNLNFLSRNKGYLEKRAAEVIKDKATNQLKNTPKPPTDKELYLRNREAARKMREMVPSTNISVFDPSVGEDLFEQWYYTCVYDNHGKVSHIIDEEILIQSMNEFEESRSDEFHSFGELVELLGSVIPSQVVFALEKLNHIVKTIVEDDSDPDVIVAKAFEIIKTPNSEQTSQFVEVKIPKMKLIRGIFKKGKLGHKLSYLVTRRNVNIILEALVLTQNLLSWCTARCSRLLEPLEGKLLLAINSLIIGVGNESKQEKIAFLEEDFLISIAHRIDNSLECPESIPILLHIIQSMRVLDGGHTQVQDLQKRFDQLLELLKQEGRTELLTLSTEQIETKAESGATNQGSSAIQFWPKDIGSAADYFSLLRSNFKDGAVLGVLPLSHLDKAVELAQGVDQSAYLDLRSGLVLGYVCHSSTNPLPFMFDHMVLIEASAKLQHNIFTPQSVQVAFRRAWTLLKPEDKSSLLTSCLVKEPGNSGPSKTQFFDASSESVFSHLTDVWRKFGTKVGEGLVIKEPVEGEEEPSGNP